MIGSRAPRRIAQVSRLAACRFPHSLVRSFLVVWFCALCPASVHATLLNFVDSYFDGADGVEGLGGAAAVAVSPDGNNVYVAGSGDSAVATFGRDPKNGQLVFFDAIVDGAAAEGLAGATAVAVSPDGAQVYVCGKSDSALTVFTRDAATGLLTFLESHFDGVDGNEGLGGATAIAVSPEATDVYVAGQSDASVAAFRRDPETGSLGFVAAAVNGVDGVAGLAGTSGVAVSPDGAHVYAVGRTENAVVTFSRDPGSGSLAFVDALVEGTNVPFGLRRPNAVAASTST